MSVWRGAVVIGSGPCDQCGKNASVFFQLEPEHCVCRACLLDSARQVHVIDRRGDTLRMPERIVEEMDLRAGIALQRHARDAECEAPSESPQLPAEYVQALAVLSRLTREDYEIGGSTITELRERYEVSACFSPKQMLLIQWRLAKWCIEHEPSNFAVSLRTDKEIAQLHGFDEWRKQKIAPYLSWEQRSKFGF